MPEKTVQKEPGKKPAPSKKPKPQQEVVVQISLSELHPFPDHPFQVREDASMQETAESVKEYGVLVPALARPREDGGYELIAGHRRKHACELAGLATMPVIVRDIDRDAATIIMVDSNLQRENILPSERAKAYKMKMEAIKRQGARTDLTSPKISAKFRSDDEVGQDAGVSGDTIRNYIALTQLVPELQQMVDEKKIALSPAYQIAALTPKEQGLLLETIDSEQATPSLSQAQRMKKLSQSGELNEDTMLSIISDTEYTIFEKPRKPSPPDTTLPDTENPYLDNPDTEAPDTDNPAQLNTKKSNTQKSNTDLSSTHSFFLPAADGMTDGLEKKAKIREQIEYDILCQQYDRMQLDELVEIMLEVAMNRSPTVKIGRDAEYPTGFVQQRFEKITSMHIEKVMDGIRENTTRVWNTKAYLMAALFNSVSTIDNHYAMLVNHDFHGGP